jgi:NADH:ubiquinone oxidoreductase subunit
MGKPFPNDYQFPGQLRKKNSVTAYLPKGNAARQVKMPLATPFGAWSAT